MNDRELLELAAKAAGYKMTPEKFIGDYWLKDGLVWNPIKDDGDALRLAVRLALDGAFVIGISGDQKATAAGDHSEAEGAQVAHGDDPYAATRRAIVHAAAEIGKAMK